MIISRLTSKAQTTIPQPVRVALGLRAGDELAYVIESDRVVLSRRTPAAVAEDPFEGFAEWESEADRSTYGGL